MDTLTITDFKRNVSTLLNKIDAGEKVYIRRGHQIYTIIPAQEKNEITPELEKIIEKGRKEYQEGLCTVCKSHEELTSFLDSL